MTVEIVDLILSGSLIFLAGIIFGVGLFAAVAFNRKG